MNKEQKEEQKRLKLAQKLEREEKARAKKVEMQKKRLLQEAQKASKPGECMKHITVSIDQRLLSQTAGGKIIGLLSENELKFEIQPMPHPNIICFWREVSEVVENVDNQYELQKRDVPQDEILMWLSAEQFVSYIKCGAGAEQQGLVPYLQSLKKKLDNRNVTIIVQGMQEYMKKPKGRGKDALPTVPRIELEEALLDVQMIVECNVVNTEEDQETAETVYRYLKAVAETPFKREKNKNTNIHIDNSTTVKIDKDGNGVTQAWRNIIQIFKNVRADQANAIMALYPTPNALFLAYQKCSEEEGRALLEDINVRRGYGALESNRRIGKELSRRIHTLFTSIDPDLVVK